MRRIVGKQKAERFNVVKAMQPKPEEPQGQPEQQHQKQQQQEQQRKAKGGRHKVGSSLGNALVVPAYIFYAGFVRFGLHRSASQTFDEACWAGTMAGLAQAPACAGPAQ